MVQHMPWAVHARVWIFITNNRVKVCRGCGGVCVEDNKVPQPPGRCATFVHSDSWSRSYCNKTDSDYFKSTLFNHPLIIAVSDSFGCVFVCVFVCVDGCVLISLDCDSFFERRKKIWLKSSTGIFFTCITVSHIFHDERKKNPLNFMKILSSP